MSEGWRSSANLSSDQFFSKMLLLLLLLSGISAFPTQDSEEMETENSRKILGSSVVTSVSVIMDTGNGTQIIDAVGKPVPKPHGASHVASPINLLNPDRYEFFTFNDNGELVKRLMTLEEIQGIIANGDGEDVNYNTATYLPEKKVDDIVNNVQNVLKEQIENHKNTNPHLKPVLDTPDVSNTWSMILPAIFGNSGEEINAENIQGSSVTADTVMIDDEDPTDSPKVTITIQEEETPTTLSSQSIIFSSVLPTTLLSKPASSPTPFTASTSTTTSTTSTTPLPSTTIVSSTSPKVTTTTKPSTTTTTTKPSTTTTKPSTTTTKSPPSTTERSTTSSMYEKLSTVQYVGNVQPTTEAPASKEAIKEDTTQDAPVITVTIISDVKYNMSNLSETEHSPIVTIVDEVREETTVATQKIEAPTTNKPVVEVTTEKISTTQFIPVTTQKLTTQQLTSTTQKFTPTTTSPSSTTGIPTTTSQTTTRRTTLKPRTTTTLTTTKKITTTKPTTTSFKEEPIVSSRIPPVLATTQTTKTTPMVVPTKPSTTASQVEKQEATSSSEIVQTSASTHGFIYHKKPTTPIIFIIREKEDVKRQPEVEKKTSTTSTTTTTTTTTVPTQELTTTELSRIEEPTTEKEKLNELLLTSTKIYEINTELSGTKDEVVTQITTTTQDEEEATDKVFTTQASLIESIQQLLFQTVNDVEEPIMNVEANAKVEEMLSNMQEKPMKEIQAEAATIGSSLLDFKNETIAEEVTTEQTEESLQLSEAVSSVLSQFFDGATTIEDFVTTERMQTTTEEEIEEFSTTVSPLTTVVLQDDEDDGSTTKDEVMTSTEKSVIQEVQKILTQEEVLPNKPISKVPAKSDLSAELELIREEIKLNLEAKKNQSEEANKNNTIYAIIIKDDINNAETVKTEDTIAQEASVEVSTIKVESVTNEEPSSTIASTTSTTTSPTTTSVITTSPVLTTKSAPKLEDTTVDVLEKEANNSWTLVSTILPPISTTIPTPTTSKFQQTTASPVKLPYQQITGFGLEDSTSKLDTDVYQFVELCNELSFGFWNAVTNGISSVRSVFVSPFAATSLLAMVFLGARGATSGEMNEILKLDDMVTFNPHMIFKNVSESTENNSGVAVSVIARQLYSDKNKGKLLNFYKERAKQFYDGHVEEVDFKEIGDVIRRRTNLIVKKNSNGKIQEYLKDNSITLRSPLAGVSASIYETDCTQASTEGRDGELHFVVLPSIRQRRLIPVPAVVYRSGFLAGYDPVLDATAAAIGGQDQTTSTIFVIPGQQGISAPGDGLLRLEKQLGESAFKKGAWVRLLNSLIPRPGLELQIPRFMHKSIINSTVALQKMGLKDLFSFDKADLRGLNGVAHELHLSDILQLNTFATCGEGVIGEDHHSEVYPATSRRPSRRSRKLGHYIPDSVFSHEKPGAKDYQRSFDDSLHDARLLSLPLPLRPRQARLPDAPRLRFDRPFLFFVRHNPTGLILHMGRFNPRLLP